MSEVVLLFVGIWLLVPFIAVTGLVVMRPVRDHETPVARVCVVEVRPDTTVAVIERCLRLARRVAGDARLLVVLSGDLLPEDQVVDRLANLCAARGPHSVAFVASERARRFLGPRGLPLFASRDDAAEWLVSA